MNSKKSWLATSNYPAGNMFVRQAQQPAKIPRIGFLARRSASAIAARIEAFRQGLRELGYIEGKNIIIEWRSAEGKPNAAASLPPSSCVSRSTSSSLRSDSNPRRQGSNFDDSHRHGAGYRSGRQRVRRQPGAAWREHHWIVRSCPGDERQTTGASEGNRSQALPRGCHRQFDQPGNAQALKETELAAGSFEMYLRYLDVLDPKEIETAFRAAVKGRADAVLVLGTPSSTAHRKQIVDLAVKHRLPATYARPEFVEAGGLMYYGTNYHELFRRAATYVDKILKGAKPADLPVEQPTKFEFIVNLKAAKQIGLKIPPHVLARADRVIK